MQHPKNIAYVAGILGAVGIASLLALGSALAEIHLGANGHGEGQLSIATRVVADSNGRFLHLENFGIEPTRLQDVHVEKR